MARKNVPQILAANFVKLAIMNSPIFQSESEISHSEYFESLSPRV